MKLLPTVLNLRGPSEPVAKCLYRLSRSPQIPQMHIAIDGARSQFVRVMRGEIDVSDGSAVSLEGVFDGSSVGVFPQIEIPDEGAMIGSRDDPVVAGRKGRPLHIRYQPWLTVAP
jgi:hypothetical protein